MHSAYSPFIRQAPCSQACGLRKSALRSEAIRAAEEGIHNFPSYLMESGGGGFPTAQIREPDSLPRETRPLVYMSRPLTAYKTPHLVFSPRFAISTGRAPCHRGPRWLRHLYGGTSDQKQIMSRLLLKAPRLKCIHHLLITYIDFSRFAIKKVERKLTGSLDFGFSPKRLVVPPDSAASEDKPVLSEIYDDYSTYPFEQMEFGTLHRPNSFRQNVFSCDA